MSELLEALANEKVFYIMQDSSGNFEIIEGCDSYFSKKLTKEELMSLGKELIELAEGREK